MAGVGQLSEIQRRVARIFFDLRSSDGYLVAGGAALLASDLIVRRLSSQGGSSWRCSVVPRPVTSQTCTCWRGVSARKRSSSRRRRWTPASTWTSSPR